MTIVILDAETLGEDISFSSFEEIGEVKIYQSTKPEEVAERVADADFVIINKVKMNRETLGAAEKLKLICIAATGYDNVDLEYMKNRGIGVCNVVGYSTDSVAQLTVAMALQLYNHMEEYTDFVSSGDYTKKGAANCLTPVYYELSGKTWGIVGLGNIGSKVAQIAKAFGCKVLANKRTPVEGFECVGIDTLCKSADIISIHTPLTDETKNLISKERIAMMKKSAVVINVARGAVCDEAALCEALKEGRIAGIGVDVYSKEPFGEDSPFNEIKNLPNVCLTPHMAWGSYEARVRCMNDIRMSIERFLAGEKYSRLV